MPWWYGGGLGALRCYYMPWWYGGVLGALPLLLYALVVRRGSRRALPLLLYALVVRRGSRRVAFAIICLGGTEGF